MLAGVRIRLMRIVQSGNVEKSHQQRSRHFVVLTYWKYAPRVKIAAALLDDFFDHSRRLLALKSSRVYTGFFVRNIQQVQSNCAWDDLIRRPLYKKPFVRSSYKGLSIFKLAPRAGLEPATIRLTAERSTN